MIIAAAAAVFAVVGDDGQEVAPSPSTQSTATSQGAAATGDLPPAPWRAAAVPRSAVPSVYVTAWDRARNRATCALLFPLDGGPPMEGAKAREEKTPDDTGWDIFRTGPAGTVEVLGAFPKATQSPRTPSAPGFTKMWADGSVAKYGPESGPGAPQLSAPFEAELTLPDQGCAYQVYDTLGKDHLEAVFDRLRLMAR